MRLLILAALISSPLVFAGDGDTKTEEKPPAKEAAPKTDEAPKAEEVMSAKAVKNFKLPNPFKVDIELYGFKGKWIVLEWINPECPYVAKHYSSNNMQTLQKTYTDKGVIWLSICSSAPGKQGHRTAEQWKDHLKKVGWNGTHLLMDPDGKVGRLFGARRTPTFWVLNPKLEKAYLGAIDDKPRAFTPEAIATAKNFIKAVLDAGLAGQEITQDDTTPYG